MFYITVQILLLTDGDVFNTSEVINLVQKNASNTRYLWHLIKPVSYAHPYLHAYIRPSTKSFFDVSEIWRAGRGRWVMHDDMQYDMIQGQGQKPFKVGNPAVFKSYLLRHLQWELATDHGCFNCGIISKLVWVRFLILGLHLVSRDFEIGRNVTWEESTISPVRDYFLKFWPPILSLESVKLGTSDFVHWLCTGTCMTDYPKRDVFRVMWPL